MRNITIVGGYPLFVPREKSQKIAKVLLVHLALVCMLLAYIAFGATMFRKMEAGEEMRQIEEKLLKLRSIYHHITLQSYEKCYQNLQSNDSSLETERKLRYIEWLKAALNQLGTIHVSSYAQVTTDDISLQSGINSSQLRWTYPAAILHSLGIITTAGYSYVQVLTTVGQVFSIGYGLIGFPLLLITAADIGKFMSEIVRLVNARYHKAMRKMKERRRLSGADSQQDLAAPRHNPAKRGSVVQRFQLSAGFFFVCTFGVCLIGAFLYMRLEGWSFVDAIYFTFNAITNVTLVEVPGATLMLAAVTVFYVIFSLTIVTMSLDLAQHQIRLLFRKIHYFGRKIRRFGSRLKLDEDVKAFLRIIATIRNRDPTKTRVTAEDILGFFIKEFEHQAASSIDTMDDENRRIDADHKRRRQTIAFCPDLHDDLKFADDADKFIEADENSEESANEPTTAAGHFEMQRITANRRATYMM